MKAVRPEITRVTNHISCSFDGIIFLAVASSLKACIISIDQWQRVQHRDRDAAVYSKDCTSYTAMYLSQHDLQWLAKNSVQSNLQELEEDPELRSKVALYKDPDYTPHDAMTDGEDEDLPDIPLEELLDDLTALQLADEDMTASS